MNALYKVITFSASLSLTSGTKLSSESEFINLNPITVTQGVLNTLTGTGIVESNPNPITITSDVLETLNELETA